jgi:hypothetical protein
MPRFHFHLTDHEDHPDPDGIELPDADACRPEATGLLAQRLKDHGSRVWENREWSLNVTDADGLTLFRMYLMVVDGALRSPAGFV